MSQTREDVLSDNELAALEAGLEGVTPGPWHLAGPALRDDLSSWLLHGTPEGMLAIIREENQGRHYGKANAAHISRCDPDTIRRLILRLRAAENDNPLVSYPGARFVGPDGAALIVVRASEAPK